MKPLSLPTTLLALILPLTTAQSPFFSLTAHIPNSGLDAQPVNAAAGALWIGRPTATYCPDQVAPNCPPGNLTVLSVTGSGEHDNPSPGTASLDVAVPGGQQLYITPSLAIGFTAPHSDSRPPGSLLSGFTYGYHGNFGYGGDLRPEDSHFAACPTGNMSACSGALEYQIYAMNGTEVTGGGRGWEGCVVNVTLEAVFWDGGEGAAAWEYT